MLCRRFFLLLLLFFPLLISAEGQSETVKTERKPVIMGSSTLGSSWYPTASRIAGVCMKYTDTVITVMTSSGSAGNIRLMKQGQFQLGMSESNIMVYGYLGTNFFAGDSYPDLRFVTNLYPLVFQAVVHNDSDIKTGYDLKGKVFSHGTAESGDDAAWFEVFSSAFKLKGSDIEWRSLSRNESAIAFRDRIISCLGFVTTCPSGIIIETSSQNPLRIIGIGGEERERIFREYSWYSPWTIPAGTYNGQNEDVDTVVTGGSIVADKSVSDDIIYDVVSTVYGSGLKAVQAVHTMSPYIELERALDGKGPVPVHSGAERFYREKGLIK